MTFNCPSAAEVVVQEYQTGQHDRLSGELIRTCISVIWSANQIIDKLADRMYVKQTTKCRVPKEACDKLGRVNTGEKRQTKLSTKCAG